MGEAQSVFIYYEVYRLLKDEFGQTRYRVSYTLRQNIRRGFNPFGALAAKIRQFVRKTEPELVVSYERAGTDSSEPIYFELDMKKGKTGSSSDRSHGGRSEFEYFGFQERRIPVGWIVTDRSYRSTVFDQDRDRSNHEFETEMV